jgi:hypothetical protein
MSSGHERPCPRNADAVGLALHALEPEEELVVAMHLPSCPSCQQAVRETEEVLVGLGVAVEQVEPPESLRERIVSRADETAQQSATRSSPISPDGVAGRPATGPSRHRRPGDHDTTRPSAGRTLRRPWLSTRGRRLMAASLALVGVLTVGGLAVRTAQLEQQRDAAISQAQSVADLMAQLDEPGTSHAVLASTADGTPVGAVLVRDDQRRLVTVGLPANATDRETYVLWGLRGETPVAIGTFDVGTAEPGSGTLRSVAEAAGFSAYAISLEPGRTAPASPTVVVATGQVET